MGIRIRILHSLFNTFGSRFETRDFMTWVSCEWELEPSEVAQCKGSTRRRRRRTKSEQSGRASRRRALREDRKEDCNEGANGVKECGGKRRKEEQRRRKRSSRIPHSLPTNRHFHYPSIEISLRTVCLACEVRRNIASNRRSLLMSDTR